MQNIIEKIKKLATKKNVSIAEIRDCIGNDRFYRISEGKSDLPTRKLMKVAELLDLTDEETLWLLKGKTEDPEPQKKIGIDIVLDKIDKLENKIDSLERVVTEERREQSGAIEPSHEEGITPKAGVEKDIALKLKKPVPP